jgi:hypothetical protein
MDWLNFREHPFYELRGIGERRAGLLHSGPILGEDAPELRSSRLLWLFS